MRAVDRWILVGKHAQLRLAVAHRLRRVARDRRVLRAQMYAFRVAAFFVTVMFALAGAEGRDEVGGRLFVVALALFVLEASAARRYWTLRTRIEEFERRHEVGP